MKPSITQLSTAYLLAMLHTGLNSSEVACVSDFDPGIGAITADIKTMRDGEDGQGTAPLIAEEVAFLNAMCQALNAKWEFSPVEKGWATLYFYPCTQLTMQLE